MEAIKETVHGLMQAWGKKQAGSSPGGAPEDWLEKILTKKELAHIKVNYFKKGVLGLRVDSSSWLYNFNLKKEGLLAELNQGASRVKDIRFRIGETK